MDMDAIKTAQASHATPHTMPDGSAAMVYRCPRCHHEVGADAGERVYGPCTRCRSELQQKYQPGHAEAATGTSTSDRFEPKMNVVPNQVATKD